MASATGGGKAHRREREVRFQLVDIDGVGMFSGGAARGDHSWIEGEESLADFREDSLSHAVRDYRDVVHAGIGIRHPIFGNGCGAGSGVHTNRLVLPILWNVYRMARRGADRKRYFFERAVRRIAAHYRAAIEPEPDSDGRGKQCRRGDGEND